MIVAAPTLDGRAFGRYAGRVANGRWKLALLLLVVMELLFFLLWQFNRSLLVHFAS